MLDEEQFKYVNSDLDKSTVLYATAGSGKTRCLVARVKRVMEEVPEASIVCITFTRNAAQ